MRDETTTLTEEYKAWWKNDKLHREGDLPAVEKVNGDKIWYKNGKLHREGDLPAVELNSGTKIWSVNGRFHRDGDKPSVEHFDGTKFWYKNGIKHREGDLLFPDFVQKEFIMKRFIEWLDAFIVKHHKCEKNMERYSMTWETIGNLKICTDVEYRCAICGKSSKDV